MENKDVFGRARVEARLNLIHETDGKASTEVLDQAARKAEQTAIEKMGEESERRFTEYAKRTDIVKSVRNSNPLEDVYSGIDKWILLRDDQELPELPVQVKSSYRDVKLYKWGDPNTSRKPDPSFTHLHGIEIVLNCGRSVKLGAFKRQLRDEVRRIRLTLRGNPSLLNFVKG